MASPARAFGRAALLFLGVFVSLPAAAQVFPAYLNYQGKLGDTTGNPLTGTYSFQFNLYNQASGGTLLFSDANYSGSNAVSVSNGVYSVQIGSLTAGGIPVSAFFSSEVWLEVHVEAGTVLDGGVDILSPRERLATSPFAFLASNAEFLGSGVAIATFTAGGNLLVPYGVTAGTFTGNGAALTNLTAANILAGTLGTSVMASSVVASGVTPTIYGDGTHVSQVTVGIDGRVTLASNVLITGAAPSGTASGDLAGSYPSPTVKSATGAVGFTVQNAETVIGTTTIQGNAFSVGVSTLVVTSGSVGIGTTGPTTGLHVNSDTGLRVSRASNTDQTLTITGGDGAGYALIQAQYSLNFNNNSAGFPITFKQVGAEKVRIDSSGNVGIGTTNPTTPLSVNGAMQTASSIDGHYYNVISFTPGNNAQTGTVKFTMPKYGSSCMCHIVIKGYDYTSMGAWQVIVGGYNYSDHTWYNTSVQFAGRVPFTSVRLGNDGSHDVMLLGTTSSVWTYGKIEVAEVIATNDISGWGTGWSAALLASESGLTISATLTPDIYTNTSGNVGVGTTSPTSNLDVNGNIRGTTGAVGEPTITGHELGGGYVYPDGIFKAITDNATGSANYYFLGLTGNATNFTLRADGQAYFAGNVGIGTTNPTSKLTVAGQVDVGTNKIINVATPGVASDAATKGYVDGLTGGVVGVQLQAATPGTVQTGNMYISGTGLFGGNVGIGTTGPISKFQVSGGTSTFGSGGAVGTVGNIEIAGSPGSPVSGRLTFGTDGTGWQFRVAKNQAGTISDMLTIVDSGYVGIGTTGPGQKLEVNGTAVVDGQVQLASAPGGTVSSIRNVGGNDLTLRTNGVDRGIIDVNGNVGIGTTNPIAQTDVFNTNGAANIVGLSVRNSTGSIYLIDNLGAGGNNPLSQAGDQGLIFFGSAMNTGNVVIAPWSSSSVGIRMTGAGNLGINMSNPSYPLDVTGNIRFSGTLQGGTVPWGNLGSFPGACPGGQYVTAVGGTLTCSTPAGTGVTGSGTTSYIPKWTGGSALGNSSIYDNGNIGVGTTSPIGKVSSLAAAPVPNFLATTPGSLQGEKSTYTWYSTFQGTGDNGPRRTADISAGFNGGAWGNEYISFGVGYGGAANDSAYATLEKMRIQSNGNVGIGTTGPASALHVQSPTTQANAVIIATGAATSQYVMVVSTGGKVGIGTTNPDSNLQIASNNGNNPSVIHLSAGAGQDTYIKSMYNGTDTEINSAYGLRLTNNVAGQNILFLPTGNVGVGTTNPATTLDVNGIATLENKVLLSSNVYSTVDNTFLSIDANSNRIGFSKKAGFFGKLAYGSGSTFAITQSNLTTIDPLGATFTDRLTIDASGNVAIPGNLSVTGTITGSISGNINANQVNAGSFNSGTYNFPGTLEVGGGTANGQLTVYNSPAASTATMSFQHGGDSLYWIGETSNLLEIGGNAASFPATSPINITNGGSVGIGTTNPAAEFSVANGNISMSNGQALIMDGTNSSTNFSVASDAAALRFNRNGLGMRLDNGGKLTIGVDGFGTGNLSVSGNAVIGAGYATANAPPTNGLLVQGSVGIGTTSPPSLLSVNGDIIAAGSGITKCVVPIYGSEEGAAYFSITDTNWKRLTKGSYDQLTALCNVAIPAGTTRKYYVVTRYSDNTTAVGSADLRFHLTSGVEAFGHGWTLPPIWGVVNDYGRWNWSEIPPNAITGAPSATSPFYWQIDARKTPASNGATFIYALWLVGIDVYGGTNIAYSQSNNTATSGTAPYTWGGIDKPLSDYNGNVGIGTTAPGHALDVQGGDGYINAKTGLCINGTCETSVPSGSAVGGSGTGSYDSIWNGTGSNLTTGLLYESGGNVGIGTTNPGSALEVTADNASPNYWASTQFMLQGKANSNQWLSLGYDTTNNKGYVQVNLNGTGAESLLLNPNGGNVGIGTTNPGQKLDVNGNIMVEGNYVYLNNSTSGPLIYGDAANIVLNLGPSNGAFMLKNNGNTVVNSFAVSGNSYITAGNVGIGTTGPRKALDVNGEVVAVNRVTMAQDTGTATKTWHIDNNGGTFRLFNQPNINAAGTVIFSIDSSTNSVFAQGNVGVGTSNLFKPLTVEGGASSGIDQALVLNSAHAYGAGQGIASAGLVFSRNRPTDTGSLNYMGQIESGNESETTSNGSYMAFHTQTTGTLAEHMRVTSAGNIGIGTTAPTATLSVVASGATQNVGTAQSTAFLTSAGSLGTLINNELAIGSIGFNPGNSSSLGIRAYRIAAGTDWTTSAIALGMDVDNTVRAGGASVFLHASGGVSVGGKDAAATAAAADLTTTGYTFFGTGGSYRVSSAGVGTLANTTIGNLTANGGGNNYFAGQVGIGTTGPISKFQVSGGTSTFGNGGAVGTVGNIEIAGEPGSPVSGRLTFGTDGTGWQFRVAKNQAGTISDMLTIVDGGNVGIGTTNPGSKLTVQTSGATPYLNLIGPTGGSAFLAGQTGTDGAYVQINAGGNTTQLSANQASFIMGGNVGIGTTGPSATLDVRGGNITMEQFPVEVFISSALQSAAVTTGAVQVWSTVPGTNIPFTLSRTMIVNMSANGSGLGVAGASCGIRFVIDGTGYGDASWGDTLFYAAGQWGSWKAEREQSLASGSHTIYVQLVSNVLNGCTSPLPAYGATRLWLHGR